MLATVPRRAGYLTGYADLKYTYNTAGQVASVTPPNTFSFTADGQNFPPTSSATYATTYDNMARPSSMRVTMADGSKVIDENLVAQDHVKNATYDLAGRMTGFQVMTTVTQVYYPTARRNPACAHCEAGIPTTHDVKRVA